MLNDFIFSLGVVTPLFALVVLGWFLRRVGMITDFFAAGGNKMMFYIGLPVIVFRSIINAQLNEIFEARFIAAMLIATGVGVALIWIFAVPLIKERGVRGAFVSCAFRGNQAFIGIPLMMHIAGEAGVLRATTVAAFVLPWANIISIFILAFNNEGGGKKISTRQILLTIVKNPIIIVTTAGLVWVALGVTMPSVGQITLNYLAEMATPLALVCIGAGLKFMGFDGKFMCAVVACGIKIIALPVLFAAVGFAMGLRGVDMAAMAIMGGVPSAVAGYAMVVEMGGDEYVAGTIVVISTAFSAFTLTVIVYALRVWNLV
jgi:predicted permease